MSIMKMPKEILLYQCDPVGDKPFFLNAADIDELPDDHAGKQVGLYVLKSIHKLQIHRELK